MKQSTFTLSTLLLGTLVYTNAVAMSSSSSSSSAPSPTMTKGTDKGLFPTDKSHVLPKDPKKQKRVLDELDRSIAKQLQGHQKRDITKLYRDFATLGSTTASTDELSATVGALTSSKEQDDFNQARSFDERILECRKLFVKFFTTSQCKKFFETIVFDDEMFKQSLFDSTQEYASWLNEKVYTTVETRDQKDKDYQITKEMLLGTIREQLQEAHAEFLDNPSILAKAIAKELSFLFTPSISLNCPKEAIDYAYGDSICLNEFIKTLRNLLSNNATKFEFRIFLSIFLEALFCQTEKTTHKLGLNNQELSTLIEKLHSMKVCSKKD